MAFIQYTKEQAKERLKELVNRFKENENQYIRQTYNEANVRTEFIDKFFILLGWDVTNEQGYAEQYKEVVNEEKLKISGTTKSPDYGFRIGESRKFFVESKKPSLDINDENEPAYQLKNYAWNAKLPVSILTNFKEFAIYRCTSKPIKNDKASINRIMYLTYDKYEQNFDELYDTFSKQAVLKGSFDKFIEESRRIRGTAEVDDEFLKDLEIWRELLAKNIEKKNKLTVHELNYSVQMILNRILFLRICEDKGVKNESIEPYGKLQEISSKNRIYKELVRYFEHADSTYNSGIFDLKNDKITTSLEIDDLVLKEIIDELYPERSQYKFDVIGVEILGNVYEQFLGKIMRITPSGQVKIEDKPEVKKAGGIYYTPQFIVDYIVANTVGKLIKGKTPKEIEKIRILDPACGSGSFLLGAYTYLINYHLKYYLKNGPDNFKKDIFQANENQWLLFSERKKKILLNNIYGVDIDPQAVEVTKLSLLLKVMENETKESAYIQLKLEKERVLPNIDNNIKCGNSLIGPEIYKNVQLTLTDFETTRRINIFDWKDHKRGFGHTMGEGGFDIIIGNPPYIQIQKLKEFYPEETDFYQNKYSTAKEKNVDIYLPFIEKSLSLLKKNGILGFICPNRFFNSDYGALLRKHLTQFNLYHLVNFRHYFVFEKADVYTCLLFIQNKKQQKELTYKEIRGIYDNKEEKIKYLLNSAKEPEDNFEIDEIKPNFLENEKWYFMTEDENKIFEEIIKNPKFKELYKEFFVGVQTSQDNVYILNYINETTNYYNLFSRSLNKEVTLEKKIVKPIIDNTNIHSYFVIPASKCVIFPYKIEEGQAILFSENEIKKDYPKTWEYLIENKKELENRENGKFKTKDWYKFGRDQNIAKQQLKKILIPHVIKQTIVAIDEKGEYCLDNVGANGIILKDDIKEHPYYFVAILNSPISTFFISKTSIYLSGGFYATNKQFAGEIPTKKIDFNNIKEKEEHDTIVSLVSNVIELKKKLNISKLKNEQDILSRQIESIETQINDKIYNIYGLGEKEKGIIEKAIV